MVKIEKKIQIPRSKTRPNVYPWVDLKVGDSFFIDDAKKQHVVFSCVKQYNINYKQKIQITTRREGKGVRVWRIK